MVTAVPAGTQPRRAPAVQEPALPAVHEGVIVTAFAAVSTSIEVGKVLRSEHVKILPLVSKECQLYLLCIDTDSSLRSCRASLLLVPKVRCAMAWRLTRAGEAIWRMPH